MVRGLAREKCELVLLARDPEEAGRLAADVRVRWSILPEVKVFDATNTAGYETLVNDVTEEQRLDGAILCHGFMVSQEEAERSWSGTMQTIEVNYTSHVALLSSLAAYFREQGHGFLCAVSSVAGDRGRQSNYVYGSAKGALTIYLQGLRNAMHAHNVHVVTVKPGFVDTSMTWGLVSPDSPIVASPDKVANDILSAINKRKNVVYTPWFWRWIMLILRSVPEFVFKRLSL